jgi:NTE family protein
VHIIYKGTPYAHSYKDYNFARSVINTRLEIGYKNAIDVLDKPDWEVQSTSPMACSIYGVAPDYFNQR